LNHAEDDTGARLEKTGVSPLFRMAVGSTSPDDYIRSSVPTMSLSMSKPAASAKALRIVEGTVEIVFPPADPNSIVHLYRIVERLGSPVESPALAEAGVTLTVFDQTTAAKEQTDTQATCSLSPQLHSDLGTLFGKGPKVFLPETFPPAALTDSKQALPN
jgi:hypothetical protein